MPGARCPHPASPLGVAHCDGGASLADRGQETGDAKGGNEGSPPFAGANYCGAHCYPHVNHRGAHRYPHAVAQPNAVGTGGDSAR